MGKIKTITKAQLLFLLCLFLASTVVKCGRLSQQIYSTIDGAAACFRRLNGTHQMGCSSTDGGAVGTVHLVLSVSDAGWMVAGGGGGGPYVALISTLRFNQLADTLMARPDNVAGVLLYENITYEPMHYSTESQCPNEYFSSEGSQCGGSDSVEWNKYGSGLLHRDIPFPIFYLPINRNKEVDKLIDCYKRFNEEDRDNQAGRPLCSVQLNSFMLAAVNTEVCVRRSNAINVNPMKQCDPLGDRNIYSALFPRSEDMEKEANRSIVLVTARIDSTSLFDAVSPGAASSVVGVVTLLTAAATLSSMLPFERASDYKRNVLWALFSGESFDYIGSQRVAYDMSQGAWPPAAPLAPHLVDLHLELGQLGGQLDLYTQEGWNLTAFTPHYGSPEDDEVSKFIEMVQQAEPKLSLAPHRGNNLPPSSLHSFRRILGASPSKGGLAELLLVDHNHTTFTNNYYQSVLDDKRNVKFVYRNKTVDQYGHFIDTETMIANGILTEKDMQVKISRLANGLARALYQRVTGDVYNGTESASAHLVDELLHCYLESAACRLFAASEYGPVEGNAEQQPPSEPYPMYTGVHTWYNRIPFTTGLVLALLTGQLTHSVRLDCLSSNDTSYSFHWQHGWNLTGVCIKTTMNFTDAVSPAFTIPGYDYKSGLYSTWTESVWRELWARMFVAASGRSARIATISGAATTLAVTLITYWLYKHSDVIFSQHVRVLTVPVNSDPSATGILRTVNC